MKAPLETWNSYAVKPRNLVKENNARLIWKKIIQINNLQDLQDWSQIIL